MNSFTLIVGAIVLLPLIFLVWRYVATVRASNMLDRQLAGKLNSLQQQLESKGEISQELVDRAMDDPTLRYLVYLMLKQHGHTGYIPKKYRTVEELTKAEMINWLMHPNELGASPDQIELWERFTAEGHHFYLYKFKMDPPHWAHDDGWLVGVVGPIPTNMDFEKILKDSPQMAFSRFDKLADQGDVSEHVRRFGEVLKKLAKDLR